jgi:hypothetical protein
MNAEQQHLDDVCLSEPGENTRATRTEIRAGGLDHSSHAHRTLD